MIHFYRTSLILVRNACSIPALNPDSELCAFAFAPWR
jgi:hypothetical protein